MPRKDPAESIFDIEEQPKPRFWSGGVFCETIRPVSARRLQLSERWREAAATVVDSFSLSLRGGAGERNQTA
jgi:hypothetical protein